MKKEQSRNIPAWSSKNLQIRTAVIMSVSVVEFFIVHLPMSAVAMATTYQRLNGTLTIGTNLTAIPFGLLFLDSIVNPLWILSLSNGKRQPLSARSSRQISQETFLNNSHI